MSEWYDRQGRPLTLEQWAQAFEKSPEKRVASDKVGGYHVSTVWLGLDHKLFGQGPPLIFETMLFGKGNRDQEQHRYTTEAEALGGHKRIVRELREPTQPHRDPDTPRTDRGRLSHPPE